MPQQALFLEKEIGDRRIEVLKTYDQHFARDAFDGMDESAQTHLWQSLGIDASYDPEEIPVPTSPNRNDFLCDELSEAASEDGNKKSFFVVSEKTGRKSTNLYVSPDWPSAEAFANAR